MATVVKGRLGARQFLLAGAEPTAARRRPLLILLHGGFASAAQVMGLGFPPSPLSVWRDIAQREQWMVLAPDARWSWWTADDVALVGDLIGHAVAELGADPARVFVVGVSKGGMLAYEVALAMGSKLRGFSAVLANMPLRLAGGKAALPVPAMIIGSTADPMMPFAGGKHFYTPGIGPFMSMQQSVDYWLPVDAGPPEMRALPGATHAVWPTLEFLQVDGGGHAEPSPTQRYPRFLTAMTGAQNAHIETAQLQWEFFQRQLTRSGR